MLDIYNIRDLSFAVLVARGFKQTISFGDSWTEHLTNHSTSYGSGKEIPRKPEISDAKT